MGKNRQDNSKQTQKKNEFLTTNEVRFQSLAKHFREGLVVEDEHRAILLTNQAFCDIFSLPVSPDELVGKNCSEAAETVKMFLSEPGEFVERINELVEKRQPVAGEEINFADGRVFERDYFPVYTEENCFIGHMWLYREVTDRVVTEKALLEKADELEKFFTVALDLLCIADIKGNFIKVNSAWEEILGYSVAELEEKNFVDFVHPEDIQPTKEKMAQLKEEKPVLNFVNRYRTKKGEYRFIEWRSYPVGDLIYASARDITERKQLERSLRESEKSVRDKLNNILSPQGDIGNLRLQDIIDIESIQSIMDYFYALTNIGMAIVDLEGNILVKVGFRKICERFHRMHPQARQNCIQSDIILSRGVKGGEYKLYKCKNNMWDIVTPIIVGGKHLGNLFSGQFFFDEENIDFDIFRAQAQKFGFNEEDYFAALKEVPRWDRKTVHNIMQFFMTFDDIFSRLSYSNIRLVRLLSEREKTLKEKQKIEEKLLNNEKRLSRAHSFANAGSWEYGIEKDFLYWTRECESLFGLKEGEFKGSVEDFMQFVYPEDRKRITIMNQEVIQHQEGKPLEYEYRITRKDGAMRWLRESAGIIKDERGKPVKKIGLVMDITRHKKTEKERQELEEQLRQAQKMEAVGRLAGGVAHDFNNMLGVIMGNVELAIKSVQRDDSIHHNLQEILKASRQSITLTGQLLAFARKQTVNPQVLDINSTLGDMLDMFRRLIGENIELIWKPGENVTPVKIDPGQVHQLLANLCVNARDAITDKGKVYIETRNNIIDESYTASHFDVMPGKYVLISVSDDGHGLQSEIIDHIFDPFFTTKDTEKGTGLGLSTVYGIVKQNSGYIDVYSKPEQGTTFKIYLPSYEGRVEEKKVQEPVIDKGGTETILIVEDDVQILSLIRTILEEKGYHVLSAGLPSEALEICKRYDDVIHLLITDLVMPEMNGKELKEAIEQIIPRIKVLFMSGYTANVITHNNILGPEYLFLQKPFSIKSFCLKVREALQS